MNILVIGNGFDLAHKLPTRYNDFLGFVERFLNIINTPQILQQGELKNTEKTVYKYIDHLIFNEQQLCKELEQLVKDNIWIEYFLQNPMYQKENWIDFENEISKVIQSLDQDMFFKDGEKSELSEKMQNLSNPFLHKKYSKYTAAMRTASALTHGKGESITYKEIRDRLYNDLNKLIRALEIYLTDYVEKEECNCVLPDIQEIVKENVTARQAAEAYGLKVGRTGMACCPFHSDKSPSMKLDERYYCFGCGATGDAVDLTAKLFGIGLREAAVKLAEDFGLNYDSRQKPSVRPRIREPTPEQKYQKEENHCYKVLTDYFHLLREWEKKYAPKQPDEEWNPLFAEALYKKNYIEYLLDILLYGSLEERKALVAEQRKEVLKLEQRIAELSADRTMHSRRNPKQLRAERER